MKNTTALRAGFLLASAILSIASCQKEIAPLNEGRGFGSGWSYRHNGTRYEGCVNRASYETINGIKILFIKGSDVRGNSVSIGLVAPDGKLTAGTTYNAAQGSVLEVNDNNGNKYASTTFASSFQFTVTAISDTSIIGTFVASLINASGAGYIISSGNVSALIDRNNNCAPVTGGSSGGTSAFSLITSGAVCSSPVVEGSYRTGIALTSANKIMLQVNVTRMGTWSASTTTANGIKFSGSGSFSATGTQTIALTGSGTPIVTGSIAFAIVAATSNCTFYVVVDD